MNFDDLATALSIELSDKFLEKENLSERKKCFFIEENSDIISIFIRRKSNDLHKTVITEKVASVFKNDDKLLAEVDISTVNIADASKFDKVKKLVATYYYGR